MNSLYRQSFIGLLVLFLVMASLIVLGAGTFRYWQAWSFLTIYFAAASAMTVYLIRNDPALAARRMSGGPWAEREPAQKIIMSLASAGFIGLIVVPAIDHRFAWSDLPLYAVVMGNGLILLGWLGIFFVFRENSFSSATIEVSADQRVVSTGPYAWVRHPMYAAGLVMLFGIPFALGSAWGVLVVVAMLPALVWRLMNEENFLARNLPGYRAYRDRVRYRLVPLIW
ncbi:MAG: isoprenylcysteine carboxylmethyltransferase family protein [Bradyrhizobium sp.]|nr:isoprenylcysteine carboxylmethyltransferase family protein [Bradyrhizobium sp.]